MANCKSSSATQWSKINEFSIEKALGCEWELSVQPNMLEYVGELGAISQNS